MQYSKIPMLSSCLYNSISLQWMKTYNYLYFYAHQVIISYSTYASRKIVYVSVYVNRFISPCSAHAWRKYRKLNGSMQNISIARNASCTLVDVRDALVLMHFLIAVLQFIKHIVIKITNNFPRRRMFLIVALQ